MTCPSLTTVSSIRLHGEPNRLFLPLAAIDRRKELDRYATILTRNQGNATFKNCL